MGGVWTKPGTRETTRVAVKRIRCVDSTQCQIDFLSEMRALSSINHPGIVRLLALGFGPPVMLVRWLNQLHAISNICFWKLR